MKNIKLKNVLVAVAMLLVFAACKKSESSTEFVADNSTFTSFKSWKLEKTINGPDPLLAATAHANNDNTVVRNVYFKDGQNAINGKYPVGTVVVKSSINPALTINEFVAMVKRGNGFNSQANDWEFFVLNADGTIKVENGTTLRGANLMNGMCVGCHAGVASKDYIFSK